MKPIKSTGEQCQTPTMSVRIFTSKIYRAETLFPPLFKATNKYSAAIKKNRSKDIMFPQINLSVYGQNRQGLFTVKLITIPTRSTKVISVYFSNRPQLATKEESTEAMPNIRCQSKLFTPFREPSSEPASSWILSSSVWVQLLSKASAQLPLSPPGSLPCGSENLKMLQKKGNT